MIAAAIFLVLPGGLVAVAMGLRGVLAFALAAPITVTISAVLAIALPYAGLPWSSVAILVGGVALSLLIGAVRLVRRDPLLWEQLARRPRLPRRSAWLGASLLVASAVIFLELSLAFATPESYSQTFDNVFHLNGVRYILDTHSASSLTMSSMASGGEPPYFYPAAWHGLAAALIQLTGLSLPVGVNVLNIAIAAVAWPLGAVILTRVVAGARPLALCAAAILSALFSAFPILLLDFGVLYPNFLSISLLPAALATVALFFGVGRGMTIPSPARFGLPLLVVPGLALAHPNGLMSLLVLSVPIALQSFWGRYINRRVFRSRPWEGVMVAVGLVGAAAVFLLLWRYIRPPQEAAFWGPTQSPLHAAFEVMTNSAMGRPVGPLVSLLMILGLAFCIRRRPGNTFWMLACFGITAALFVIVSGIPVSAFRTRVTGVWYNDSYRLAALLPLTAIPFAAMGADALATLLRGRLAIRVPGGRFGGQNAPAPGRQRGRLLGVGVLLALLTAAGQVPTLASAIDSAAANYREGPGSPLVSSDEQKVIDRLDELVPAGSVIAVNPWTGAAMAYALADRDTTARHVLTANTSAVDVINAELRNADVVPGVCDAVRASRVGYVLDFGTLEVHGGRHPFPGLENLEDSTAVKLVLKEGDAKLYKLTACQN